jgi:hypothetical protein
MIAAREAEDARWRIDEARREKIAEVALMNTCMERAA